MDSYIFQRKCKEFLIDYYQNSFNINLKLEDIYVVWSYRTLQKNKVLMSTNVSDNRYCLFIYNADKNETHFDIYIKENNTIF